ncbi:anaerobic ribonucleoside-triphosphate reductase activating protein [Butyrivibrio sp. INlla16]|uniref:anaerobic ribonucleoside-triphosphate reductase activating protein n=1 Tax=Butyrivibrio sp. INlla16 TaxID=1520807 RepID=UPI000891CC3E|nr:anaerobic ribonucleoside-triphosphate reductase activating protein [Butyrivibrio sp. INlla16]SDB54907.1 anaerobic ribonucleoside-triphosphate reductase activating protein [Butyrivibrio sp. INlla16]
MNYGEIKTIDIANGTGVRTSLFVSGCTHHCKGCFNEETWDFNFGKPFTKEVEDEIIESLSPAYVNGLTILGGEPMEIQNQKVLRPFIERVRREFPNKSIWVYSGYLWEELTDEENKRCHSEDTEPILSLIDVLVDGEFKLELKNISLRFRGSSNQRVINVPATRESGSVVLSEFGENDN